MSNHKTAWRPADWERAKRMRKGGMSFRHIAETLHVSEDRVKMKFANEGARARMALGVDKAKQSGPSDQALLDRERRHEAELARSTTQTLCGDPPPGFSALDKKHTGATG